MISYKMLLGGVVVIALLVGGAYASLSTPYDAKRIQQTLVGESERDETVKDDDIKEEGKGEVEIKNEGKIEVEIKEEEAKEESTSASEVPVTYTSADVALHGDASSCWTIVEGKVYDLTSFVSSHPGGERNILKLCGRDGTSLFMGQHEGDTRPESRLRSLYIGELSS